MPWLVLSIESPLPLGLSACAPGMTCLLRTHPAVAAQLLPHVPSHISTPWRLPRSYAPMADVGGMLYDKDAVYIDIPDWKRQYTREDGSAAALEGGGGAEGGAGLPEGEAMVRRLQAAQVCGCMFVHRAWVAHLMVRACSTHIIVFCSAVFVFQPVLKFR